MSVISVISKTAKILKTNKSWLFAMVFLFSIFIEQLVKYFVSNPFKNFFFAFSLPIHAPVMYGVYLIVLTLIINYLWQKRTKLNLAESISWVLILSGAVSNISERVVLGYVRDFIYITFYKWTGVYNLADGFILFGICLLLWLGIQKKEIHLAKR